MQDSGDGGYPMPDTDNVRDREHTRRTSVTFSVRDYSELERIAARKKVSVAWVVREAVERYLNEEAPLFRSNLGQ